MSDNNLQCDETKYLGENHRYVCGAGKIYVELKTSSEQIRLCDI